MEVRKDHDSFCERTRKEDQNDGNCTKFSNSDSSTENLTQKCLQHCTNTEQAKPQQQKETQKQQQNKLPRTQTRKSTGKTRIKIGNWKPNTVRDFSVFLFLLVFFIYIASLSRGGSKGKKKKSNSIDVARAIGRFANSVNHAVANMEAALGETMIKHRRKDPCSLFALDSSIPGAGRAIFAGKSYKPGDVVANFSEALLPISLDEHNSIFLPHYAFLLKHHPHLVNVKSRLFANPILPPGDTEILADTSSAEFFGIRAVKEINPGDELFLSFEEHPHGIAARSNNSIQLNLRLFPYVPTLKDYELADSIRLEADEAAQALQPGSGHTGPPIKRVPLKVDPVYSAVQKSVAKINPIVAKLLPHNVQTANRHKDLQTSALAALNVKSLAVLQAFGTCLSDLVPRQQKVESQSPSTLISDETAITTSTRSRKEGEVVAEIPMIAIDNPMSCAADLSGSDGNPTTHCRDSMSVPELSMCLGQTVSSLVLCPLVPTNLVASSSRVTKVMITEKEQNGASPQNNHPGNVVLRWKYESISNMTAVEVMGNLTNLIVQVIAARDLKAGEELRAVGDPSAESLRIPALSIF